jgi:hypothetical protein
VYVFYILYPSYISYNIQNSSVSKYKPPRMNFYEDIMKDSSDPENGGSEEEEYPDD